MTGQNRSNQAAKGVTRRLRQYEMAERLGKLGHWYWQVGAETVVWSPEVYRIFGVTPEEFETTNENSMSLYEPKDRKIFLDCVRECIRVGTGFEFEAEVRGSDGASRFIRAIGESERGDGGRATAVYGVIQDITEHKLTENALAEAHQRQSDFLEMSSDWLWEMGPDLRFTYVSPRIEQTLGVPVADVVGKTRREMMAGVGKDGQIPLEMEMHLAWVERHKPFRDFRYWREGADGRRTCMSTSGKPIFDRSGAFVGYRGSARDVTEEEDAREALMQANRQLKGANKAKSDAMLSLQEANALLEDRAAEMMRVQAEIRHTALHDPLTGIGNRRYLDERISTLAASCRRSGNWLAVLHIDLDRFKQINDTAGHAAGDALLVHVARTLTEVVRHEDFVARIGGDEFVVLCTGECDMKVLGEIADRIIKRVSVPFIFEGRECWFGASIGIASSSGASIEPSDLLVNADIALYRAKNHGRGRFEYFSAELQSEIVHNKQVADGIRAGMARGEFVPFYQPQMDARTFELTGFEALARWRHPREGILPPVVFLDIAADLSVVAQIDKMILEQTVADHASWTGAGLVVPKVSVNVSARRLVEPDLIAGLRELNLPAGVMSFELLESVFLDDADELMSWNIDMLKEMGIDIELDDFGSGHASIVSLVKLGPDAIKIDRELVSAITEDPARRNLVRSIIDIGRSLNVKVIAEGVETLAHAEMLRDLGCDFLQGYYFSRPIPGDEVRDFIIQWTEARMAVQRR